MIPTLHVETIGQGPPLVMLHGWGWHSGIWQPLIPMLSKHYQLFLIDLPGFGKSIALPKQYTAAAIAALLFDVVPDQAAWLGWSLGGMLAWWIAIHHPEKINYLVTIASSPRFVEDGDWPGVSEATLVKFADSLMQNYEKTQLDFLALQLRGHLTNPQEMKALQNTLFAATEKPITSALLGGLALLRTMDLRPQLHKVKCSSLHIFGHLDTLVPAKITQKIEPLLPNGRCEVIKRSGHMPFLSQQHAFLNLLLPTELP